MKLVPVSCNHHLVFRYIITSTHNSSAQHDGSFSCFMTLVYKIQQWILVHNYLWRSKYFKICLLVRVRVMRSFFWLRTMNARHVPWEGWLFFILFFLYSFRPGSVIADFILAFNRDQAQETVTSRLVEAVKRRTLGNLTVDPTSFNITRELAFWAFCHLSWRCCWCLCFM